MVKSTKKTTKKVEVKTVEIKKTKREAFKISKEPYDVAMPEGFTFVDFKLLKRANFTTEALYFEHRAEEYRYKTNMFDARAVESRTMGSSADRRKKKQIVRLNEKMNELKAQLTEQGIDVEALIAAAATDKE